MATTQPSLSHLNENPHENRHGNGRRPFAIVTSAARGLGYELALCCARHGFDLLVAAEEPRIFDAAKAFSAEGVSVEPMQVTLDTIDDVDELYALAQNRPVDALLANGGRAPGPTLLDQDFEALRRAIETGVTGTVGLLQKVGRAMRARQQGRILITGSLLDPVASALRAELKDIGVTVTWCADEAVARRNLADLARACFDAMMRGAGETGLSRARASFPAAQVRTAS